MAKSLHIFALWIGWSSYQLTRGMSITPSTSLMIDITKKIDNMGGKRVTKEEFLRRAKLAHGDFEQRPNVHLKGHGCHYCGNNHKYTTKEYVTIASQTHSNKYNYDKTIYKGSHQKVTITCPIHGDFVLMAYQHLQGCGCSKCRASLGENRIRNFLETNKIEHIGEYKIYNESPFCKNRILYVDFFLTKYNIVIEYNGEQHYKEVSFFIKRRTQKEQQERDNAVRQYCKDHKIKLIEIPYTEYDNIENILKRELKI